MGKLTIQEVEDLKKAGLMKDPETEKYLQEKGLVGTRKRGNKRFMTHPELKNVKIFPQLYFQGLGKTVKPTSEMEEIRTKFNEVINTYTKEEKAK